MAQNHYKTSFCEKIEKLEKFENLKKLGKIGAGAQIYIFAKMHCGCLRTVRAEFSLNSNRRARVQTAISILSAG